MVAFPFKRRLAETGGFDPANPRLTTEERGGDHLLRKQIQCIYLFQRILTS